MKIPNGDRAVVDIQKLEGYCLDPSHEDGKHKAEGFLKLLGMTAAHAHYLRRALLSRVRQDPSAKLGFRDGFGQRYALDFELEGPAGKAIIRSGWIIRGDEDFPRLATCYVKKR